LNENKTINQVQEELLKLLPQWNDHIIKPFKKFLDEGISLEMYYCIQRLKWLGGVATMTELAKISHIPKHQMTKLVNRLVEYKLVERLNDPKDRRIVRIELTENAQCFIDYFLNENSKPFRTLIEKMEGTDRETFYQSVHDIYHILYKLSCENGFNQKQTETEK